MSWTSLRVGPVEGAARDAALVVLFDAGAQGVLEDGAALVTHFPPGYDIERLRKQLARELGSVPVEVGVTEEVDWSTAWRDRVTPQTLGRLVVTPPWLAERFDPAQRLVIDPGMAFGTGDHASTRGCLRLLQGEIRPGWVAADLGTGSGVLAIAAAKLGASRVFAIDHDPDAIPNAEANVAANGVAEVVHVFEGDAAVLLPLVAPVDIIFANIISSAIVELLPSMSRSLRGPSRAVLGGVLLDERPSMLEATAASWRIVAEDVEGDWWCATIEALPRAERGRRPRSPRQR
ncbi:MAG: 50S ribosomal protein L11 methyltransferase [Gemmatimonadota bacterium]